MNFAATPKVEIAFTTDPLSGSPSWTDVTADVASITTRRGRQQELDVIEAGTCTVKLKNGSRKYDPTYTLSTYYPNVLPMRKIRISATYSAVTYYLFTGYIERWPIVWEAPKYGTVTVTAVDAFTILNKAVLVGNATNRVTNWGFESDTTGWSVTNGTLTRDTTTTYAGVGSGKLTGHATLATTAYPTGAPGSANGYVLNHVYQVSGWVYVPSGLGITLANVQLGTFADVDGTTGGYTSVPTAFDTWTKLEAYVIGGSGFNGATGLPLGITLNEAYVQFKLNETGASKVFYIDAVKVEDLGAFANFDEYLDLIAQDFQTGYFPQETTGRRIDNALNAVPWPTGDTAIDVGIREVQAATLTHDSPVTVLSHIQETAAAEPGLFFIDGQGKPTFQDVSNRYGVPSSVTFTDPASGTVSAARLPYTDLQPDFDVDKIYNEVSVARSGGTVQTATDSASQTAYARRTLSLSPPLVDDDEANQRAHFEIALHSEPKLRFDRLTVKPQASAFIWPFALGLELSDKVTIQRTPGSTPLVTPETITRTCFVEAIEHTVTESEWVAAYQLSPGEVYDQFFTLGTAVLTTAGDDTTAVLAY